MVKTTRQKRLLIALVILAGSAVVAFAAFRVREAVLFARLSDTEKKVIGVWTWTSIDAVGRMKIRPDHRLDMWFIESKRDEDHPDARSVIRGRWKIEGTEFRYVYDPGQGSLSGQEQHGPLADFGVRITRVR
ncbi:MAG TPA: hypothetical protein VEX43_05125 [Chthoniobacterales bacterium]|nr:hypothetical protein [Chthoniobacterales bacterium]